MTGKEETVTCGIDVIRQDARETLDRLQQELTEELLADFGQEADAAALAQTAQARALRGALESYAVWLVHTRLQETGGETA